MVEDYIKFKGKHAIIFTVKDFRFEGVIVSEDPLFLELKQENQPFSNFIPKNQISRMQIKEVEQ